MRIEEFTLLLYNYWPLYVIILCINLGLTYICFKGKILSIIDPLFLPVFFTALANTVPPFLYCFGEVNALTFFYFLCSVSCFWGGFFLNNRQYQPSQKVFKYDLPSSKIIFYLFFVCWLIVKCLTYYYQGIPLLMQSRLDLYINSGGLGILGRIETVLSMFCLLYSFYRLSHSRKSYNFWIYLYLLCWTISAILSGSKSAFWGILNAAFFYCYYIEHKPIKIRNYIKYISIAAICGLITLIVQRGTNVVDALYLLLIRFIANGDIYWEAYPLELESTIAIQNPLTHIFQGLLGGFRIIDYEDPSIGTAIGFQVHSTVYPELSGMLLGPNARIPIISYIMYGWGGIIFSFMVGYSVSFLLFKVNRFFPKGIIGTTFFALLYMNALSFITDPVLGGSNLFNTIIGYIVLLMAVIFSNYVVKHYGKSFNNNSSL